MSKSSEKDGIAAETVNNDDEVLVVLWHHWKPFLRRVEDWISANAFAASPNICRDASHKVIGIDLSHFKLKGSLLHSLRFYPLLCSR